jgi:ligand-binding sensor domain-containing protein/signal transduction histidine kinase
MAKLALVISAAWLWSCGGVASFAGEAGTNAPRGGSFVVKTWVDGLPQSSVIAMTQTRDGYLWLGTLKGLVRFDGVNFTVFDENNTPGLNNSRIVYLFEDSRSHLWVGTETAGIALVKDGRVIDTGIGAGSAEGRLSAACEDSTGAVWLYTADGRLCRYENGNMKTAPFGATYLSAYRGLAAENSRTVWMAVDWGLYGMSSITNADPSDPPVDRIIPTPASGTTLDFVLASRTGGYWRLANGRVQKWKSNALDRDLGVYPWTNVRVTSATEDHQGNLIVGTLGGGVFWFDAEGKATTITSDQGLSHNGVLSLCVDREGSLWVGTDGGGLNRVKPASCQALEASLGRLMQSVCEDAEGALWVAWGGTVVRSKDGKREEFVLSLGASKVNASTVLVDRGQRVWAGTLNGGLFRFQNDRFESVPGLAFLGLGIHALHEDRQGRLWAGTQAGLARWDGREWRMFTTRDGLSANAVRCVADDSEGNLWVGTEDSGLNRFRDSRFTVLRKDDGVPGNRISSFHVDGAGVLWVGTDGGGLGRYESGKWTRYTKDHGLASNGLAYLIEDDQGSLWIGSNAGLMRVLKESLNAVARGSTNPIACRTYGRPDGLPTLECSQGSQPAVWRAKDGKLWFTTIKGLISVEPKSLRPNPYPPPVKIESVLIEGEEQNPNNIAPDRQEAITIPARKEQLELHYTSLNLAAADRARFKYRMEGHDTTWFEAGDSRVARYPKLPPGDYRFRVAASNEDGVWNEEGASLGVIVLPAFWQTWTFRGATILVLLLLVGSMVYHLSTQKLQRELALLRQKELLEKERARIARDLHDQLGANLTQVALLGELAEADKYAPDEVESHARQISQTARETTRALDEIVWAANPANDTLDSLITYTCKYAQDYLALAGLRHRLEVPPQLPGATILPEVRHNVFLAFKEAVHNVVKHAQASEARIRLLFNAKSFTLEVEDNGRGMAGLDEEAAARRNGLRNMRKRMEDIGGTFEINPRAERGTRVRLTAPLGSGKIRVTNEQ